MGIEVPPEPPELPPGELFRVIGDIYAPGGCETFREGMSCVVTGAVINAYYAAGGDCITNNNICFCFPNCAQRITRIQPP